MLHASGEDYLETILLLQEKQLFVRSIDVANELSYSKASVSRAMGKLRELGYITMSERNMINLTDAGRARARQVYERHCVIERLLTDVLGVSGEAAASDACLIEHVISEETFDKMREYIKKEEAL